MCRPAPGVAMRSARPVWPPSRTARCARASGPLQQLHRGPDAKGGTVINSYQYWLYVEEFLARMARGEPISKADVRAYAGEKVQFIDEQLSAWWQIYCLGEMSTAALRDALEEIQAITHAAMRYAQD